MGDEEGASNDNIIDGKVRCFKNKALSNGLEIATGNNCGDEVLGTSEGFRTYKRRKRTWSSSESKGLEDGRDSVEAASKLANQNIKELHNHYSENHAVLCGSNEVAPSEWRSFVLKHIYQSLSDDEGGIKSCIRDALMSTTKDVDTCDEDRHRSSLQTGWMTNGTHIAAAEHAGFILNGIADESHHTANEMCQRVFHNIILSEEFTLLCKLLFDNFEGMNVDKLFSLRLLNKRMKEGIYECSPMLFSLDIQKLWEKLQGIGNELISLAKSLADASRTCYNEEVRGSFQCKSEVEKNEFCTRESDSHGKPEQMESCCAYGVCSCQHCGDKVDGKNCLVCDSCEEIYHVSCIKPAVKEIPPKSWYCASCTAIGFGASHENCVVCERLSAPRTEFNQAGGEITPPNEETVNEIDDTSNYSTKDVHHQSEGIKDGHRCKICGSEVENGERLKICDHPYCPSRYYHVRCLNYKHLNSYGPRWYCPSCLCRACLMDKDDDKIVLCDSCDHAYHIYCMDPPRSSIPRGKWFCKRCAVKIEEIRRAKLAYENIKKKLKKQNEEASRAYENLKRKLNEKCAEDLDKGRGRMHMLATAALKYEVGTLSSEELRSM